MNHTQRLEELRTELRNETISLSELAELNSLIPYIDSSDNELREAAGVPEYHGDEHCPVYDAEVLPDEDDNCSLCGAGLTPEEFDDTAGDPNEQPDEYNGIKPSFYDDYMLGQEAQLSFMFGYQL